MESKPTSEYDTAKQNIAEAELALTRAMVSIRMIGDLTQIQKLGRVMRELYEIRTAVVPRTI